MEEVLSHPKRWAETFGATRRPPPSDILVFLGSTAGEQEEGAAGAKAAGYDRTLALAGTLANIEEAEAQPPHDLAFLRADALALLLMGEGARQAFPCPVTIIDVRRWEERLLFGSIRTSQALPGGSLRLGEGWSVAEVTLGRRNRLLREAGCGATEDQHWPTDLKSLPCHVIALPSLSPADSQWRSSRAP